MFKGLIQTLSFIEEWNEKLNSFFNKNFNDPLFGTIALFVLFIFGCWIVSYFNKTK